MTSSGVKPPAPRARNPGWRQQVAGNLALAVGYGLLGAAATPPATPQAAASLLYLAPGLATGFAIGLGPWLWPGILAGAFILDFWRGMAVPFALAVAVGATLYALLCERLLRTPRPFDAIRSAAQAARFGMMTIVLAPLTTLLSVSLMGLFFPNVRPDLTQQPGGLGLLVVANWLGIGFGGALVAPAVLVLCDREARAGLWQVRARTFGLLVLVTATTAVATALPTQFSVWQVLAFSLVGLSFTLAGIGLPAAALPLTTTTIAVVALVVRARVETPISPENLNEGTVLTFWALGALSVVSLFVTATLGERERLRARLEKEGLHGVDLQNRNQEFFLVLSHELRTPLNSVLLAIDLLLESTLDEEQRDLGETVARAGASLRALIDDTLDLSRTESGRMEIRTGEIVVPALFKEATDVLGQAARKRKLAFRLEVAPDTPEPFLTAPDLLRRILLNLVGNAVKYGGDGEVLLLARGEAVRPVAIGALDPSPDSPLDAHARAPRAVAVSARPGLRIEIVDDGPGIPAAQRALIFEPFARLGEKHLDSTTAAASGTGLGLAITRSLVQQLGGEIGVRNRPDRPGSVFWIVLPSLEPTAPSPSAGPTPPIIPT